MSEFVYNPKSEDSNNLLSEILDIVIRIKEDDYGRIYNQNNVDGPRFEKLRQILTEKPIVAYFQRQREFEHTKKESGRVSKISNYKVIVPIESEQAIELIVGIYLQDGYSFKLNKSSHLRVIPFFQAPKKDFEQRNCQIKIRDLSDYSDFKPEEEFRKLLVTLDRLNLPVLDLNKEIDRRIWRDYVAALKKLIKQKEQVWKIKKVNQPYLSAKEGQQSRDTFIDIFIDEGDLRRQFESEITTLFLENELEDYSVRDDKAFIEFTQFRSVNENEVQKLKELGEEYFYELTPDTIYHYIAGEIRFKYGDMASKQAVFDNVTRILREDYKLEAEINKNGEINLRPEEINCLDKIVSDKYEKLLKIEKETAVSLKVTFKGTADLQLMSNQIKKRLDDEGFTKNTVIEKSALREIHIEVPTYLHPNKFVDIGVDHIETISRYSSSKHITPIPLPGLQIVNNEYQISNASKEAVQAGLDQLTKKFPTVQFRRKASLYRYKVNEQATPKQLRDFKVGADVAGKSEFDISLSTLQITVDSSSEYESILRTISSKSPLSIIESKPFKESFVLTFKNEKEDEKRNILNQLQNSIRTHIKGKVEFDVLNNTISLLFRFIFKDTEERMAFIDIVRETCSQFSDIIDYSFENILGRTVYELYKNESLEIEKEKETLRNIRQASFVFLTPDQKRRHEDAKKTHGDNASFKEGLNIGTLLRKDKDKLQFKIKEEFDRLITGNQMNRLELKEIANGYIKPIFPGELTNLDRMIKAMEKVTNPGEKSKYFIDRWGNRLHVGYPINRNLPNFLFDPTEARDDTIDFELEKTKILTNLNEPLLRNQPKQLEAVIKAITAKDLALIQGPPGTGKTTVIAEIIWQTLLRDRNAKILITSQTNLAVDNALERLTGKRLVRPIRIGNIEKFEDEGKAYSNERIKKWLNTREDSKQLEDSKDNAVCDWIDAVCKNASADEIYKDVISKWKKGLEHKEEVKKTFGSTYFRNVNVFAATCSECGSRTFAETFQYTFNSSSEKYTEIAFDLVIVDEASKATPPELVLPLTFGRKVVIIGDHKQLPPMIDEDEFTEALAAVGASNLIANWDKDTYKISQFEKLFKNAPKSIVTSLDTQFRMHEQIMNCISQFYKDQEELENGLICGIKSQMDVPDFSVKASRWHGISKDPFISPDKHAIWINVETPETKIGTSYENEGEIKAIQEVLRALKSSDGFKEYYDHTTKEEEKEIGIITYYMPQMMKIRRTIYSHLQSAQWRNFELYKYENEFQLPLRINTVDKFQGMERNIVIVSTVRSNKQIKINSDGSSSPQNNINYPHALGFARELQRVNVGLSRAKRLLIVIGNQSHFAHKNEYLDAMKFMHCVDIKQLENIFKI